MMKYEGSMKVKIEDEKKCRTGWRIIFFLILAKGAAVFASTPWLPDSLVSEDNVYEYTFSDFDKARQIMQQLRTRKSLPAFRLDITEGDLYFNTGRYYQALTFYHRALLNDSVATDDRRYMEQVHRLISCYDCLHNEVKKTYYVERLLKKAEQCGDVAMQSIALFNMGKMLYYQGNKEKGYDYMQRAADGMEQTDYKYKYDNLRYNYNTLLVFRETDRLYEEALRTIEALEKVVGKETKGEIRMDGLAEKERKALHAHRAVVLFRLNREEEAEEYYRRFLSLYEVYPHDNYLIMPYLFDRKMYDEVIRMNTSREKTLIAEADTVNYHMATIKRSLGQAYKEKGDYRKAARYFESLAVLRDSIKNREQKSAALELAALYETNEKDLFIQQQAADMRMRNVWLGFVACIVGLLGIFLGRTIRYNRKIRRKNDALVATIEDLLGYKEELCRKREENLVLQARLREALAPVSPVRRTDGKTEGMPEIGDGAEAGGEGKDPRMPRSSCETGTGGESERKAAGESGGEAVSSAVYPDRAGDEDQGGDGADTRPEVPGASHEPKATDWYDSLLFERVQHEITKRLLYLQPDFSREELIKTVYIPKNKFAPLFKQYAGKSFPKYVNDLRLEHAARMLKEYPDYTVDTVARSCGMSTVQTFHRLFLDKFGVTPAEFRTGLKHVDSKGDMT